MRRLHRTLFSVAGVLAFAFLIAPVAGAKAETAPIYSAMDRLHPVYAAHGMVASQEALATNIGVEILKEGGNAVDAAVAVGFALAVTLPEAGNLGGGGFMLVHMAKSGETVAIDYREKAPLNASRDMFLDAAGNADPNLSRWSGLATGVPGTVAGLALALQRYGTMSLAEVMAPAIKLAEDGVEVTPGLAEALAGSHDTFAKYSSSAGIFLKPDGSDFQPGDRLVQTDLASSLKAIAKDGPDAFYRGEIGRLIAAEMARSGGLVTVEDLAKYQAVVREPVHGTYRGYDVVSMPPPSSGGTHVIEILNILEGYPIGELGFGSAQTMHLMAEAMQRAYADRSEYLGDSDFVDVPVEGPDEQGLCRGAPRRDRRQPCDAVGGDQARQAAPLRERPDHAFLRRRQRGQRRLQHLHAEFLLRLRSRRGRNRHSPQQRDGRFLRQARRAQRLRPDRRRRQRGRAGEAPALLDEPDHRPEGRQDLPGDRQPGRQPHHHHRAAGDHERDRPRHEHRRGDGRAAHARPVAAGRAPRRGRLQPRHFAAA